MNAGLHAWAETQLDVLSEKETRRGYQIYATCPFCGKGEDHFSVNVDTGIYACYICGDGLTGRGGGSYVNLILALDDIDTTKTYNWYHKKKLVDDYLEGYVEDLSIGQLGKVYAKREQEVKVAEEIRVTCAQEAIPTALSIFADHPDVEHARKYLFDSRGIPEAIARELGITVGMTGDLAKRIILPVWEDGKIVSYTARAFGNMSPRYMGPPVTSGWLSRSNSVFGLDRIEQGAHIIVVEGVFDCLALWDLPSVAILGKSLSTTQLRKIAAKRPASITILLDADTLSDTILTMRKFIGFTPIIQLAVMFKGADPSSDPKQARQAIVDAINFFDLPPELRMG